MAFCMPIAVQLCRSESKRALTICIKEPRRQAAACADMKVDCEMVQHKVQRAAQMRDKLPRERMNRRGH